MKKSTRELSEDLKEFFKIQYQFLIRNKQYLKDYEKYSSLPDEKFKERTTLELKYKFDVLPNPKRLGDWHIIARNRMSVTQNGRRPMMSIDTTGLLKDYDSPFIIGFEADISCPIKDLERDFKKWVKKVKKGLKGNLLQYRYHNKAVRKWLRVYDWKVQGKTFNWIAEKEYLKKGLQSEERDIESRERSAKEDYAKAKHHIKNAYKIPFKTIFDIKVHP